MPGLSNEPARAHPALDSRTFGFNVGVYANLAQHVLIMKPTYSLMLGVPGPT